MTHSKIILFASAASLVLLACSPSSGKTSSASTPAPASHQTTAQTAPAKAPAPAPVKMASAAAPAAATMAAAAAQGAVPPPSAKRLYLRRTCIACHGKDGSHAIQQYPNLAGLDAKYIREQVKDILSGKRKGSPDKMTGHPRAESMRGALVTHDGEMRVTDDEIKIIAAWLAGLPSAGPQVHDPALSPERIAEGKSLYNKSGCRTCHGVDGKKPLPGYPRVAGQKSTYIAEQLRDIRDGARTNGRARMMVPFAKRLDDAKIDAVADFLSQVNPN